MSNLVPPHGGKGLTVCLLEGAECDAELKKAENLKKVAISPRVKGDLIMIGIGGFSPLTGFMTKADWQGVCEKFLLSDGTFWPVPVTLDVEPADAAGIKVGDEVETKFTGMDRKTRILSLSIKAKEAHDEAAAVESYKSDGETTGGSGTSLGDLLKEQISGGSE